MTPYYQDNFVTLYHGDCREIVPGLGRFDLLLTDPPYGIDYKHSGKGTARTKSAKIRGNKKIHEDSRPFDPREWLNYDNVIIWGADHFYTRLPEYGRFLVWNKLGQLEPWDSFSDVEMAWHSKTGKATIFSMLWKGVASAKNGENNGRRLHVTKKPERLMRWCIEQAGDVQTILDPFAGSGTTGRAAKDLGRKCTMIEYDERYCEVAARYMAQEVLPMFEKPAAIVDTTPALLEVE